MNNLCLFVIVLALAACGGGDDDEPAPKSTQPVSCAVTPDLCR